MSDASEAKKEAPDRNPVGRFGMSGDDDFLEEKNDEALRSREEEDFYRGDPSFIPDDEEDAVQAPGEQEGEDE